MSSKDQQYHQHAAPEQKVSDISAVLSTEGCSNKDGHVDNDSSERISGIGKARAESVTRTLKMEI